MTSVSDALVSVIIPVYGVEDYLARCVHSVLGQSYSNLEVILVDDGSPDHCPEICDAFAAADPRVFVIHKENGGPGPARNSGIEVCTGDFIMFIDSDDWVEKDMVRDMLRTAQVENADLVQSGFRELNGIRERRRGPRQWLRMDNESLMREYLVGNSVYQSVWARLYARHLWASIRFPDGIYEDVYITHEILGQSRAAVLLPDPYYIYCKRPSSIQGSAAALQPGFGTVDRLISDRLVEYVSQHFPHLVGDARYKRAVWHASRMTYILYTFSYRSNQEDYRILRDRLRSELPDLDTLTPSHDLSSIKRAAKDGPYFRIRSAALGVSALALRALNRVWWGGPILHA